MNYCPSSSTFVSLHSQQAMTPMHLSNGQHKFCLYCLMREWSSFNCLALSPWSACQRTVNCEFLWAKNDSFVALKCTPFDVDVGGDDTYTLLAMSQANLTSWNDLYVLDIAARHIHIVARTPDFSLYNRVLAMNNIVLAPNGRYVCSTIRLSK